MTSALDRSGYVLGSGWQSPNGDRFLLTIPKNASTFLANWARQNHWRAGVLSQCPTVREVTVVLRDPVSRWVSGMAQYINTYILTPYGPNGPVYPGDIITEHDQALTAQQFLDQYNTVVERLLFDVVDRFDDHVLAQNEFLELENDRYRMFLLDSNLVAKIMSHLDWNRPQGIDTHAGEDQADTKTLQDFLRRRLITRPELVLRLSRHYAKDQQLINSLTKEIT